MDHSSPEDNGLSSRGLQALTPTRDDLPQLFNALGDQYHPVSNPQGFLSLLVAENKLNWAMMKAKLEEENRKGVDDWVAGYGDTRGNPEFRTALAAMMQDTFVQVLAFRLVILHPLLQLSSATGPAHPNAPTSHPGM